ncbi:MAG: hypothetical protein V2B19_30560 [Pseudomonadota bacterium]
MDEKIDLTQFPEGHEALKQMLDFLPTEEEKKQFLVAMTLFLAMM